MEEKTYDVVTGEWLINDDNVYDVAYEVIVTRRMGPATEFIASKAVVERIVEDQERLYGGDDDSDQLRWDGDTLVVTHPWDAGESRFHPIDDLGNYEIGFGWVWQPLDDMPVDEIVGADGEIEVPAPVYVTAVFRLRSESERRALLADLEKVAA